MICITLCSCSYITQPEENSFNSVEIINSTCKVIKQYYPFLEFKKINIDNLNSIYKIKAQNSRGDEILGILSELLYELKDGHVWYYTPGGLFLSHYKPRRTVKDMFAYNPIVRSRYFPEELKVSANRWLEYGFLNDKIGYIYVSSMKTDKNNSIDEFEEVLKIFQNTKGLILDVRHNEGGSNTVGRRIIGCFLDKDILDPGFLLANGTKHYGATIYPNSRYTYLKPVVVLQNGVCFSATDDFINVIKNAPTVTCVGDTTGGGGGVPTDFYIIDRIKLHIPWQAELNYNGNYIEWNGVAPDILVPQTENDIKGNRDLQLEKAISIINSY